MTKKLFSKIVSAILVMAICLTTVFGCLMTVSAADATGTYTIVGDVVPSGARTATAEVTFTGDTAFTAGSFDLMFDSSLLDEDTNGDGVRDDSDATKGTLLPNVYCVTYADADGDGQDEKHEIIYDTKIEIVGGVRADGTDFSIDDFKTQTAITPQYNLPEDYVSGDKEIKYYSSVSFATDSLAYDISTVSDDTFQLVSNDTQYAEGFNNVTFATTGAEYKSITFKVTFDFTGGSDRRSYETRNFENGHVGVDGESDGRWREDNFMLFGSNYTFDVTASSFSSATNTVNFTGEAGNIHTHRYIVSLKDSNLISDGDGFNIYMGACNYCDHTAPQMVPDGTTGDAYSNFYPHNYKGIYGTNIVYENDGTLSLNLHFPEYVSGDTLYVAYENGDKTKYNLATYSTADGTVSSSFYAAEDGSGVLVRNAKLLKLTGLSAKDVDTTLYIARYNTSNGQIGTTYEFSIADYCMSVINGDKVYYVEGTPSEQIVADQAVAAALINYGYAAKDAMNAETPVNGTTDTWDGGYDSEFTGSGTSNDPYIIDNAEGLAWLATQAGFDATNGKYYKVADGIAAFNMNTMGSDLSGDMTAERVYDILADQQVTRNWWSDKYFAGHFDGNGVEIYGLHSGNATNTNGTTYTAVPGLFPSVDGAASIKNLTVKNSYFSGSSLGFGAIIGLNENDTDYQEYTIENCTVKNNYFEMTASNSENGGASAIAGWLFGGDGIVINNCLAYDNVIDNSVYSSDVVVRTGLVTYAGSGSSYGTWSVVKNTVAIGVTPWTINGGWHMCHIDSGNFENIYTDQSLQKLFDYASSQNTAANATKHNIYELTVEKMQGNAAKQNMTALDWENSWAYGYIGEYPSIAKPGAEKDEYTAVTWDGQKVVELTLLDSTAANSKENPYLITKPGQLYALVRGDATYKDTIIDTDGAYFKVADGIDAFYMNGGETVANMASATEVETYFANNGGYAWWAGKTFKGNFDGNGITIYGHYATKEYAGIFHQVEGATIKNMTVKNSYIYGNNGSNSVAGAIFGSKNYSTTNTEKTVISNCVVANNYIGTAGTYAGAIGGTMFQDAASGGVEINNCLVYDNIGGYVGLIGQDQYSTSISINNTVAIGCTPYTNSVKLMKAETFSNVYTDQTIDTATYEETQIKQVAKTQMQGIYAKNSMPTLDWYDAKTNPDGVWYRGAIGKYPSFEKADNLLPAALETYYDQIVSERVYDTYGVSNTECGMFGTSLNLKVNPYISFTLAFNKQYKTDRANIDVTFSAGNSSVTVNGDDMINNVANGAGRYHMYRFKTITVENLSQPITVSASYGGTTYDFGKFTVGGFALDVENYYNMVPCDYYKYCANAANALMFYVAAVNYRYGNV